MLVRCCMHDLRPTLIKLFFFSASRLISHHQRDCQHLGGAQVITDTVMSNDKNHLAPEEGTSSKKDAGLLQVPSRSSSQKNQGSPTTTGLSGATASEARNSISGQSRESKRSLFGRQRNGSASSKRTGGDSEPTNAQGSSPGSPTAQKKKKSGSLLALLGCCGSPSANTDDGETENAHKLDKLPQRPTSAKSRTGTPQDQPAKQVNEKETPVTQPQDRRTASGAGAAGNGDEITSVDNSSRQAGLPAVTLDSSNVQPESEPRPNAKVPDDTDVDMSGTDADEPGATSVNEPTNMIPTPQQQESIREDISEPEPTKWLLPPIASEHKGRKCLVLDLDETLVHSSFKVSRRCGALSWVSANAI